MQVLSADINVGYRLMSVRCMAMNGSELRNVKQLAELVDTCR